MLCGVVEPAWSKPGVQFSSFSKSRGNLGPGGSLAQWCIDAQGELTACHSMAYTRPEHLPLGRLADVPVAVLCNSFLWLTSSVAWRIVRSDRGGGTSCAYGIAFAATSLLFAVTNIAHFFRRVTCYDCFFPYGLPFKFYRDAGEGGGGGLELRGLAADVALVIVSAALLGGLWQWLGAKRDER